MPEMMSASIPLGCRRRAHNSQIQRTFFDDDAVPADAKDSNATCLADTVSGLIHTEGIYIRRYYEQSFWRYILDVARSSSVARVDTAVIGMRRCVTGGVKYESLPLRM